MPASDLTLLIDAAQRAADLSRSFVGQDFDVQHKPQDNSPVTEVDLAVNDLLEEQLRSARPDYGWLSEESTDDETRLSTDRVFVVDPIDGTRSFVEGSNSWSHALAVVEQGQVTAAVVILPMLNKLYSASLGGGARLNGLPIRVSDHATASGAEVLATKQNMQPEFWRGNLPDIKRHHRPSLAYRLSLVAEGRFDAMFTFRPSWEWDIASGALIMAEAGARVTDRRGGKLRFNNPHPQTDGVLGANPDLHADLLDRIA
ncbi:MAG: 3'(2'),5'-bisphosphate nucleotidase CysQ [Pelagimonas sp.]